MLTPWQPFLLALAVVQITWGFYQAYKPCCEVHAAGTRDRRIRIGVMWVVAAFVVGANGYHYLPVNHDHEHTHVAQTRTAPTVATPAAVKSPIVLTATVKGMHCGGCAKGLAETLAKKPVFEAVSVKADGSVRVEAHDPVAAKRELAEAVKKLGLTLETSS